MLAEHSPLDVDDPIALREWAAALQLSETDVLAAAKMVGRMPSAILFYLKSKSRKRKTVITAAERAKYEVIKLQRRKKRPLKEVVEG